MLETLTPSSPGWQRSSKCRRSHCYNYRLSLTVKGRRRGRGVLYLLFWFKQSTKFPLSCRDCSAFTSDECRERYKYTFKLIRFSSFWAMGQMLASAEVIVRVKKQEPYLDGEEWQHGSSHCSCCGKSIDCSRGAAWTFTFPPHVLVSRLGSKPF